MKYYSPVRINKLMKYYSPVHIDNLSIIQQKVFELFPKNQLDKNNLFYLANNIELFLNIPELKIELDKLEWTEYIHAFGFYVTQKTNGSTIHTDTGNRNYSFNIPILNCNNTFVNYYTTNSTPIRKVTPNNVDYYYYDPVHCNLIDSFEMNSPHIINVLQLHNITNHNSEPRITLLMRLKNELSLDHLFI
jgi:hypothetical protein